MEPKKSTTSPPFIVRDSKVKEVFGISPSQARRLSVAGMFAPRRKFGPGIAGYLYEEAKAALLKNAQQ